MLTRLLSPLGRAALSAAGAQQRAIHSGRSASMVRSAAQQAPPAAATLGTVQGQALQTREPSATHF